MLHAIDLHKSVVQIASMCTDGKHVQQQARLQACERALRGYLAQWPGVHHRIVAEATGSWYWLDDFCRAYGAELTLAHPWKLRAITGAKVKTDPADALTLLTMFRLDLIPPAHKISPELRELRDLMRLRLRLVGKRTSCMNSIARLLEKYNRTAVDELPELAQLQVRFHREQIAGIEGQIRHLERTLHRRVIPNADVQRLLRIPGIGRINALTIYLEIDSIARFPHVRNFFSYCRLVPGAHNSAASTRSKRSRAGNRYLKLAFSHAGVRAVAAYPEIRDAYRKRLRKKNQPLAQAWVRKELARIVYHVLSQQSDFSGIFCGQPLRKLKKPQWPLRASPSQQLAPAGSGLGH
ncbi:MAG TPA: IS110 family transposase [Longimicrobiaceae bacterium]|nr:IS110 family transposase [Longimicrobiaceae bacterium]